MLLKVLSGDKAAKTFTVASLVANVVLSLDALPLQSLLRMGVWTRSIPCLLMSSMMRVSNMGNMSQRANFAQ